MKTKLILTLVLACALEGTSGAAVVDVTQNTVQTNGGRLKQGAAVPPGAALSTGTRAKLQVSVGDKGGVLRTGSKTEAVLASEDNLALSRGILLASSGGRGLRRENLNVETPETRTSVKGTMLVAYQPRAYIKITCIEGKVSIRLKALLGEIIDLRAGQMVIINPAERNLPEVVEVDLRELAASTALLGGDFPALGVEGLVAAAATRQANALAGGALAQTNLRMEGAGPALFVERGIEGQRPAELERAAPPRENNGGNDDEDGNGGALPEPEGYIIDDSTVLTPDTVTTPGFRTVTATREEDAGGFSTLTYDFPATGTDATELLLRRNVFIPGGFSDETVYRADGLLQIGDGLPTVVTADTLMSFHALHLRVNDATVQTTAGSGYDLYFTGAKTEIEGSNLLAGGGLDLYGDESLDVSDSVLNGSEVSLFASGPVRLLNTEINSHGGISIGNDSLSDDLVSIAGSTLTSSAGPINIYSYGENPDISSIVISDSRLIATAQDIFIGGPDYRSGISITGSELTAGGGGIVGGINMETGEPSGSGPPVADAGAITLASTKATANGGNIHLQHNGNNSSRTGIVIQNSSELRALAASGSVFLTTAGARIEVSDSLLEASSSGGQILIDTLTTASPPDSLVTLSNVTANADIIRARSYNSADRDALVVNGGNFNAASLIKFYAEGASRLRFTGDVQLNAREAALAGKIVQVDAGGNVDATGAVNIYSDDHRYNTSGFGNIRSSGGSTSVQSRPFTERPGF